MEDWSIPEDLITNEILTRVPAKSLLRFQSVCKAWYSAISSRHFIELHRQRSQSKVHVLRGSHHTLHGVSSINIERLTEEGQLQHYDILPRLQNYNIINSSHDFILLTCKDGYLLANPATRELVHLPRASWDKADFHFTGFGFVSSLGKYKVISVTFGLQDTCEVVTVGMDNSWRKGRSPPYPIYRYGHIPYVNGNLHMLSLDYSLEDESEKLLLFNLEKEEWSAMALPDEPRARQWPVELREMQGLVCFICCIPNKGIDIWMLRDHANNVWSKDFVIDVTAHSAVTPCVLNFEIDGELFGCFPLEVMVDGKILLQQDCDDGGWFYYDPRDGSIKLANQSGISTANYAENLVPIMGF